MLNAWPSYRGKCGRFILGLLPFLTLVILYPVLVNMASYDVVGVWVIFYLLMGYAWIYGSLFLFERCLDIYRTYDVIFLDNKAALATIVGSFVGITLIYAGANTGDGPGWWAVVIAGLLGLITWIVLAVIIHVTTDVSERVTVERDLASGIRFGSYLASSGLILARACGGDWTSFQATLVEFLVGWPVLLLMALAILVEDHYNHIRPIGRGDSNPVVTAVVLGIFYFIFALLAIYFTPAIGPNSLEELVGVLP